MSKNGVTIIRFREKQILFLPPPSPYTMPSMTLRDFWKWGGLGELLAEFRESANYLFRKLSGTELAV